MSGLVRRQFEKYHTLVKGSLFSMATFTHRVLKILRNQRMTIQTLPSGAIRLYLRVEDRVQSIVAKYFFSEPVLAFSLHRLCW